VAIFSSVSDKKLAEAEMINGTISLNLTKEAAQMVDWRHPILIGIVRGDRGKIFWHFLV